jgi:hypothetical protein
MRATKRDLHAYRRLPPPPTFDLTKLADGQFLTAKEVSAIIRRAPVTLERWRKENPDHLLRWERVAGRPLYRAGAVKQYLQAVTVAG